MRKQILFGVFVASIMWAGYVATATENAIAPYRDSLSAADTVATAVRYDTVTSNPIFLGKQGYAPHTLNFFVHLTANGTKDTNWVNDTFFVNFQHSFNRTDWITFEADTLLDTGLSWSAASLKADDSVVGDWGRLMMIHKDSMEAAVVSIKDSVYLKVCSLWISPKY